MSLRLRWPTSVEVARVTRELWWEVVSESWVGGAIRQYAMVPLPGSTFAQALSST